MTPMGSVLANRTLIASSVSNFDGGQPRWNGSSWAIAFGGANVWEARFTSAGLLGSNLPSMGNPLSIYLSWNGTRHGVVWVNNPNLAFISVDQNGLNPSTQVTIPSPGMAAITWVRGLMPTAGGFVVMRGYLPELVGGNWQNYLHFVDSNGSETKGPQYLSAVPATSTVSFDPVGPAVAAVWVDVDTPTQLRLRTF